MNHLKHFNHITPEYLLLGRPSPLLPGIWTLRWGYRLKTGFLLHLASLHPGPLIAGDPNPTREAELRMSRKIPGSMACRATHVWRFYPCPGYGLGWLEWSCRGRGNGEAWFGLVGAWGTLKPYFLSYFYVFCMIHLLFPFYLCSVFCVLFYHIDYRYLFFFFNYIFM